jgi:competence protein ComEC
MRCMILGFAAGAAFLQTRPSLPDSASMAACAAIGLLLCLLRGPLRAALAGTLFGFAWAALLATLALAPQLPSDQEGRDITLTGTIASLPYQFDGGVRFNFAVENGGDAGSAVPPRVALAWYTGFKGAQQTVGDVQPGERWQLTVRLQRPHGNANPEGFDYEVWLLEQGVRATGYVRPDVEANRRIDSFVWSIGHLVEHCRATLRERIRRALPDKKYAGVIVALVVGDQRAINQSDWKVFNRTGVGHLISISGLHITMVAGLFALLASGLWRRSFFTRAQLPLLLPAQKVAALAGAGAALLYVLLAGFGIPAQRTLYMLAVVAIAVWTGRIASVSHVLCAALGVVVLLDPWSVLAPGFWLSFGAVAVILFATVGRTQGPATRFWSVFKLGVHTQYVVTLGLVPLTMLLFSQFSLASPVANAIAIPLISLVVTPLALAGAMLPAPLSTMLLTLAHAGVEALAWVLERLSALPMAVWSAPEPEPWVFCFAMAGTLWMLAPRGWPMRWLGAVTWLPLLAGQPSRPADGQFDVTAFDVGQGIALLIETSGHRLLYDTGPAYSPESNGANRVILPYLPEGARHRYAGCDGGQPQRRRSFRRGADGAGRDRGRHGLVIAVVRASDRASGAPSRALRRRPVVGMGRRALRDAAPGHGQLRQPGAQAECARLHAAHFGRRSRGAAGGRYRSGPGSATGGAHAGHAARRRAAGAASRQRDFVHASLPGGGRSATGAVPGGLPQPLSPSKTGGGGALPAAAHRTFAHRPGGRSDDHVGRCLCSKRVPTRTCALLVRAVRRPRRFRPVVSI